MSELPVFSLYGCEHLMMVNQIPQVMYGTCIMPGV